jgi:hypothetical protein
MFNCNIHVIFLSRGVILTTNHFFRLTKMSACQNSNPLLLQVKNVLEGAQLEVIQQSQTKEQIRVLFTLQQSNWRRLQLGKEHPKRMHRYYVKPFISLCIDKEHVLLFEKVHICLLSVNEFYFYNFCLTNACQWFFQEESWASEGACECWEDGHQWNLHCYNISLFSTISSNNCVWLPHYYVLRYVLVFSMILTLGVFGFILYEQILFGFNGCRCLIHYIFLNLWF